jgi:DNA-binding transcriptional ArsR family regulator
MLAKYFRVLGDRTRLRILRRTRRAVYYRLADGRVADVIYAPSVPG